MYKVVIALKEVAKIESLKEAMKSFFEHIFNLLREGTSYQLLETACWLETPIGVPVNFYDARDMAIDEGWLEDGTGKWIG